MSNRGRSLACLQIVTCRKLLSSSLEKCPDAECDLAACVPCARVVRRRSSSYGGQPSLLAAGLPAEASAKAGGAYRDRTDDPLLAKQVLSQLS